MVDNIDRRPLLALGQPGQAIDLSIRLAEQVWESPTVKSLLREFNATPLACSESRRLGAGAWLDEWEMPVPYLPEKKIHPRLDRENS